MGVVAETEEPPKKRVAAYCRVSTDQEAQETSLEEQMAHFNTVIAEHPDWELALVDAKPEQVHIEYESEECEMEILKGFEVINLKQPKGESVMTVTSNSLKFNKATAVELNYAPYIKVLLNAKTRQIAIQPCSEKDPNAIKFSNEESKQTYAISITI